MLPRILRTLWSSLGIALLVYALATSLTGIFYLVCVCKISNILRFIEVICDTNVRLIRHPR